MRSANSAHAVVRRSGARLVPVVADEELADRVAAGDDAAFSALYARHGVALYRYCRSIVRDESDAQDALQSAWVKALVALQARNRDAPLRPWLYRICHNEAVSLLRRRLPLHEVEDNAACVASAEQAAVQRERFAGLITDLHSLPERARSALVMREELCGLSHEEIATALQTSVGGAKQSILEARRGLSDLAAGREADCADICQTISDGDRRLLRGRRVRAHLADCGACAGFAASVAQRRSALRAALPALSPPAVSSIFRHALRAGHGPAPASSAPAVAGAGGAAVVATTGKGLSVALIGKALVGAAIVGVAAWGGVVATVDHRRSGRAQSSTHRRRVAPAATASHSRALIAQAKGRPALRSPDVSASRTLVATPHKATAIGAKPAHIKHLPSGPLGPASARPRGSRPTGPPTTVKPPAKPVQRTRNPRAPVRPAAPSSIPATGPSNPPGPSAPHPNAPPGPKSAKASGSPAHK